MGVVDVAAVAPGLLEAKVRFLRRWWIRHRLLKCGCALCMSHLEFFENEIWPAEKYYRCQTLEEAQKLYSKALAGDPK